jgi:hypothetical protein
MEARLSSLYLGSYLFSLGDLQDPTSLAAKLKDAQDPLSLFLQAHFWPGTRQLLDQYDGSSLPSGSLQTALVDELNRVLHRRSLYDPQLFAAIPLTDEIRQLIQKNPQGAELIRLNRLLLEAAYPREIAKSHVLYPLLGLTTRSEGDPAIALLDSWATVADVLTFYEERIANEGYLRTATERRSILELARLVGYALRPGVAASVYLAFTMENGFAGEIPAGTRAQSLPGPGELPQSFETSEKLAARAEWNNLQPRLTRPQTITCDDDPVSGAKNIDTLYFQGTSINLKVNDPLLIVCGDDEGQQFLRFIQDVNPQPAQNRTEVTLQPPALTRPGNAQDVIDTLNRYIGETSSLFPDSEIAKKVADILSKDLVEKIQPSDTAQTVADLLRGVLPQLEETRDIAVKRKYTRLAPWISGLVDTLTTIANELAAGRFKTMARWAPGVGIIRPPGGPIRPPFEVATSFASLEGLLKPLSKPPSLQPTNALVLPRSVQQTFAPQSDIAPRLLTALRPAVAPLLYKAWANVVPPPTQVQVYALRVKASLFGHSSPGKTLLGRGETEPPFLKVVGIEDWPVIEDVPVPHSDPPTTRRVQHETRNQINLDGTYDKILPNSWVVVQTSVTKITNLQTLYAKAVSPNASLSRADYGVSGKMTQIELGSPLDPADSSLDLNWITADLDKIAPTNTPPDDDFKAIRQTLVYAQAELLELAEEPIDADIEGKTIELDRLYDGLDSGRWIIVSGERTDIPDVTGVTANELVMLAGVEQVTRTKTPVPFPSNFVPFSKVYYVTDPIASGDRLVVGASSPQTLQGLTQLPPPNVANQEYCDPVELAPGIFAEAYVPTAGERQGDFTPFADVLLDPTQKPPVPFSPPGKIPSGRLGEIYAWRIKRITGPPDKVHTTLILANKLAYTYEPDSVTIYGNVVKATHGETRNEVLGSGDGSKALQQFPLRQSPLTYLSAPTPAGAQSTLQVRVNDILWHEADNLTALKPTDRDFITQTDDADKTTVIFGNGEHGARLPTGVENVKALYRTGIGKPGNVKAKQISLLATRPLGLKSVINPLAATAGADRDSRDQARRNAPLAVMALDRLVSVRDYADFARTFAGIGKASASRLSDGRHQVVHVTIAGAEDIPIDVNSALYRNLTQALHDFGDPFEPIQVGIRKLKLLVVSAKVRVLPDYQFESVAPKLRNALLDTFGFDRRELGQSAFLSEVISTMQAIEGVGYVDVEKFDKVPEDITVEELTKLAGSLTLNPYVEADLARINPKPDPDDPSSRILPAELAILTLDVPDTLILTELTG